MPTYDAIVLGAGAMGSAAAYYLAKAGQRVLLLEQFEIDHQKGSSYGFSRIIRYSYDDPRYIELAKATYPLWFALEDEAGDQLYIKTGGIDFGTPDEPSLQSTIESVKNASIPHEILTPAEAVQRFPQFRFDDDMTILYQPDSGMLRASLCVRTHIRLAQDHGAIVADQTPVTGLTIHAGSVEVTTPNETISAGKLVITGGAWLKNVLAPTGINLPLYIMRCQPAFFEPAGVDPAQYTGENMPVFIYHKDGDLHNAVYGMASLDGSGVKAAFHGGDHLNDPSEVNYTPDDPTIDRIRSVTRRSIPAIGNGRLKSTRICLYTMTPDTHFIIDHHPQFPHVVIGGGFSGHGFKFSTTIGKILTDLALDGSTPHDISLFRATRFT